MDHRARQDEYRRLKRERAARLVVEAQAQSLRRSWLQTQRHLMISHNELLNMLHDAYLLTDTGIVSISPVEGGWDILLTKQGD